MLLGQILLLSICSLQTVFHFNPVQQFGSKIDFQIIYYPWNTFNFTRQPRNLRGFPASDGDFKRRCHIFSTSNAAQPLIYSHWDVFHNHKALLRLQHTQHQWRVTGKEQMPFSHLREPHVRQGQTEVVGWAPLLQQSLMVATTRGTVSTTAIRQVWSELLEKMKAAGGEKRLWVCIDTFSSVSFTHTWVRKHTSHKLWYLGSLGQLPTHIKNTLPRAAIIGSSEELMMHFSRKETLWHKAHQNVLVADVQRISKINQQSMWTQNKSCFLFVDLCLFVCANHPNIWLNCCWDKLDCMRQIPTYLVSW